MLHKPGYIIVDTEGTGLFVHKNPDGSTRDSDAPGQPRMAAFAAILTDADLWVQDTYSTYIKPEGWLNADGSPMTEMPQGAFDIHGLTMEYLHEKGIPAKTALQIYIEAIKDGRAVLGFNQQHDGRQVRAELRHAGLDDMFEQTKTCCVMRSIQQAKPPIKIKKLNSKGGWPRLIDAAAHFDIPLRDDIYHDALVDAMLCRDVAWHIRNDLLEPEVHYAAGYKGDEK